MILNLRSCGLLLLILAGLEACNSKQGDELRFPLELTMDKWIANPILDGCYNPWEIQVNDSLLFLCEPMTAYPFIKIYDNQNYKQISAFGQQGNGPNEYLSSGIIQVDKIHNMLWFIDFPTHTFHGFGINNVLDTIKTPTPTLSVQFDPMLMPVFLFNVMPDTSIIVPTCINNALLTKIDKGGHIIDSIGCSPDTKSLLPCNLFNNFYFKYSIYSAKRNKVISAYRHLDKVVLFDLKSNTRKQLINKNYKEYMPEVRGENIVNNHKGYFRLKESGDFLFALYLGGNYHNPDISQNYPHEIQVFDWDLNPIVKLTFPEPIVDFAIKDSMLYLLVADRPNPLLVYQLDENKWK